VKVLVTGASGFIGRNFVLSTPRDWRVTAIYRGAADFADFVARRKLAHVNAVSCDLASPAAVRERVPDRVDAVVHLASNGDPAFSVRDPHADLLASAGTLVSLLSHVRCDRLVYFSSGAIYDGLKGAVGPETPVAPTLPYSIAKQAAEHYVRFFRKEGHVGRYAILRFFGAYGAYEPARKIFTRLVRWATAPGHAPFEVRGDGKNLIDAMYVDDTVRGIHRVLAADAADVTVDFANGAPITIDELVETAAAAFGKRGGIRHVGSVPEYIEFSVSAERMERLFSFRPEIPLEDGLRRLARHLAEEVR
jgi:nucleoside-diphosphate-sugar epimerase